MKEQLRELVAKCLENLFGLTGVNFSIEFPKELAHGDYATNVALVVGKQLGKDPTEVAQAVVGYIHEHKGDMIGSISVAGPGFINFTLTSAYFHDMLHAILEQKEKWGSNTIYKGQKILVEHSSPNLFKPFHIGHLMNNTVGESIVRLAKASGADVTAMAFPSDISLGVAKAIYILLEKKKTLTTSLRQGLGEDLDVSILGEAYVAGVKLYDEDESIRIRVKEIADNLYAQKSCPEWELFQKCRDLNIAYFEQIVAKLGSKLDSYIYESEAGVVGKEIVQQNTPRVFIKSEGAIVYIPDESKKSLHTAVFINSQGNPTYEAKDIGLLDLKFKHFNPDLSVFVTDNEQVSHFNVVLDAATKIAQSWAKKSRHVHHGRMSFNGSKMSSRLGGVPLVEDILATVIDEVKEKNPDITEDAAKAIGIAALKFGILRAMVGKDINFDPDTSLSFEGDSGPYLQYTAVRAQSVIDRSVRQGLTQTMEVKKISVSVGILERLVVRFPDIVERATQEWAPHHIVGYLLDLAQAFNSWYGSTKIIEPSDTNTSYRLALTHVVSQTLRNGLDILGIQVPEKM